MSGDEVEDMSNKHGCESLMDLFKLEAKLNNHELFKIRNPIQIALGSMMTFCRLKRTWLANFDETNYADYLSYDRILSRGHSERDVLCRE